METHLRPMSLGEILDRTAQLYRSNFVLFWGIAAFYAGSLLVVGLVNVGLQEFFKAMHWSAQVVWLTGALVVLQWLLVFLIGGLAVAANNRAVSWVYLGQQATIRASYRSVWPILRRILWLMTIIAFVVWTPLAIGYSGMAGAVFWSMQQTKQGAKDLDPQMAIIFAGIMLLCLLLIAAGGIYGILMGLRYALAVPACVVEGIKARAAIRRSITLTKGARGQIFLMGLLVVALEMALTGVTQLPFLIMAFTAVKSHGTIPVWAQVLQQILGFITTSLLGPIYATALTLFYYDQRVKKEGFDIEWMMQAAGLEAPAAETHANPLPELAQPSPATETAEAQAPTENAAGNASEDAAGHNPGEPA